MKLLIKRILFSLTSHIYVEMYTNEITDKDE